MSTIPLSEFASHLQRLNHDEFCRFVADLWSLAGWETAVEGSVVVVRRGDRERRLLVLRESRLGRLRSGVPTDETFDTVVSPRIEENGTVGDSTDAQVVDANDLRHRLIYGSESEAAARLWQRYFDTGLRGTEWDASERVWTLSQLALGTLAVVMVVVAIGVLIYGLPFIEAESPSFDADSSTLEGGLDMDIETGPPDQTVQQPTSIAWGETVYAATENGTIAALDGETGETVWSRDLGTLPGTPIAVNGSVYAHSSDGIEALDAVTGNTRWEFSTEMAVSSRPTVVDGELYFGTGSDLVVLNAQTGEEKRRTTLSGRLSGSASVYDGTVYVATRKGVVYALETTDSEADWSTGNAHDSYSWSTVHPHESFNHSPIVIPETASPESGTNETLLVTGENHVYAFDVETGDVTWVFQSRTTGALSAPVVVNSADSPGTTVNHHNESETNHTSRANGTTRVYVADIRSFVYVLDPATGDRIGTHESPGIRLRHPVVGGSVGNETSHSLYLLGNDPTDGVVQTVFALNATTGSERWEFESQNQTLSPPTVANDTVFTGTDTGDVLAIDAERGTERWRVDAFEDSIVEALTVVARPLGGDSVDARVQTGIHGHHDWLYQRERSSDESMSGLAVVATDVPERVAEGEEIEVQASVVNPGDSRENTTIEFDLDWPVEDEDVLTSDVDLAPGTAQEVTVSVTAPGDPGEYDTEIRADGQSVDATTITVTDAPRHEVTALDDPDNVWQGDEVEIIATVHNTGDVTATTPIGLEFGGEIVESTQETLEANETASVTFTLSAEDVPSGEYNYSVATNDDVKTAPIEVLAVDQREDAFPVVIQVFGLTLLVSGLALAWWVFSGVWGPLFRRDEARS